MRTEVRRRILFLFCMLHIVFYGATRGTLQAVSAQPLHDTIAWDGTLRRVRAPILMYHYVSDLPADADDVRRELTVSPEQFRAHLAMLFYEGYTPISIDALHRALMLGEALPAKPVVLTFDDAYIDHYSTVFPALVELDFVGTFFVPTAFVDAQRPGYLSWEQIRQMAESGMSMEPHTKSHVELVDLSYDAVVYEVLGSIESLAHYTGIAPHIFSYPVGRYDALTLQVMSTTPIWRAVTTERGALHTTDNRLEMARVRVPGGASADQLSAILAGS